MHSEEELREVDEVISIPEVLMDKARTRIALALLNKAPLTPAQKEKIRAEAHRILGHTTASMK